MKLTFHAHDFSGNQRQLLPAYYMDRDVAITGAIRIHAEDAPIRDASFDIYADGSSIFRNRTSPTIDLSTGVITEGTPVTTIELGAGENTTEIAGNFGGADIVEGSWVTCDCVDGGGGRNFTVQLELEEIGESL